MNNEPEQNENILRYEGKRKKKLKINIEIVRVTVNTS